MAIETVGDFQLHLIAYQVSGSDRWDPFVTILKFDDASQNFKCVLEKHHAADQPLPTHREAIDAARRAGTALIESGRF